MTRDRLRCGAIGEDLAVAFLTARGLAVVTRNFRCAAGEIDVVARDGRTIVFCEVRTRRTAGRGSALESVTPAKQRQVCRVAAHYTQNRPVVTSGQGHRQPRDLPMLMPNSRCTRSQNASRSHSRASW
jgi:uncharacterized protein (TIGR00252 family)